MRRLLALALLPLLTTVAQAESRLVPPVPDRPDAMLAQLIAMTVADEPARFGVAVKHLLTGQYATVKGDEVFEAASLYKLAVMVELFFQEAEGSVALDAPLWGYAIIGADEVGRPIFGEPMPFTLRELLEEMITLSDNAAAQYLLYRLGPQRINARMQALGLTATIVDWDTTTTPREMLRLLEGIAAGQLVSPAASAAMLEVLLRQRINDRIPQGLPAGVPIAHKTGNLDGIAHDAAIVYAPTGPFILVVLSDDIGDLGRSYGVIQRLARLVYEYFAQLRWESPQPVP
ncbi:MAG: class A beta-lactamase-related serine hydrolase [Chloroflexi bacterium]|nr:class A beta-lactamase-related serine hydrolase [Chloroflexota bacterium]